MRDCLECEKCRAITSPLGNEYGCVERNDRGIFRYKESKCHCLLFVLNPYLKIEDRKKKLERIVNG